MFKVITARTKRVLAVNRQYFLFLVALITMQIPTLANAAPPVLLHEETGSYSLGPHLDILEDLDRSLTLDEVNSEIYANKWLPNQQEVPNFGFKDAVYWIRIQVDSQFERSTDWLLELAFPDLDHIVYYESYASPNGSHIQQMAEVGDQFPFPKRKILYQYFLFDLSLQAKETKTIYLRIHSEGAKQFPLTLYSHRSFEYQVFQSRFYLGLYYGIMLVMILYNLFIMVSVRDTSYLYYICYIIGLSGFQLAENGLGFELLWPNNPWWAHRCITFFMGFGIFFSIRFTQRYLNTQLNTPRMHRVLNLLLCVEALVMLSAFTINFLYSVQLAAVSVFPSVSAIVLTGILCVRNKYRPAYYFMTAWVFLLAGTTVLSLRNFGILPSTFLTHYGLQIGASLEVVLLSLGLADRINLFKQEALESQKASLENLELRLMETEKNVALTQTFKKFVPQQFIEHIAKDGVEKVTLGQGESVNLSLLFSDIRAFTSMSEELSPQELLDFLNSYFKLMSLPIHHNHGYIDKFIGDAILAIFDKPGKTQEELANDAVYAAIDMQKELSQFNKYRQNQGHPPIVTGIGVHTGVAVIGTVGSDDRMDSTVIGDTVNITARLESLTKIYNASIIVSYTTLNLIDDISFFQTRKLDLVKVKGKNKPVEIYEIFNNDPPGIRELKKASSKKIEMGLIAMNERAWGRAILYFQEALDRFPKDAVAEILIKRCLFYQTNPPDSTWDGSWTMR